MAFKNRNPEGVQGLQGNEGIPVLRYVCLQSGRGCLCNVVENSMNWKQVFPSHSPSSLCLAYDSIMHTGSKVKL